LLCITGQDICSGQDFDFGIRSIRRYESATLLSFHEIERVKTTAATRWLPEFQFKDDSVLSIFAIPIIRWCCG
jgi:hypothetical protein